MTRNRPRKHPESYGEAANDDFRPGDDMTLKEFERVTGISVPTVRGWMRRRYIRRGEHYSKKGNTIIIRYSKVMAWFHSGFS